MVKINHSVILTKHCIRLYNSRHRKKKPTAWVSFWPKLVLASRRDEILQNSINKKRQIIPMPLSKRGALATGASSLDFSQGRFAAAVFPAWCLKLSAIDHHSVGIGRGREYSKISWVFMWHTVPMISFCERESSLACWASILDMSAQTLSPKPSSITASSGVDNGSGYFSRLKSTVKTFSASFLRTFFEIWPLNRKEK